MRKLVREKYEKLVPNITALFTDDEVPDKEQWKNDTGQGSSGFREYDENSFKHQTRYKDNWLDAFIDHGITGSGLTDDIIKYQISQLSTSRRKIFKRDLGKTIEILEQVYPTKA